MQRISNATRISIGLTLVTLSVMAGAYALGLVSRNGLQAADQRLQLSQMMAVQFAAALEEDDPYQMLRLAESLLGHMPDIQSMAIRRTDGSLLFASADHEASWDLARVDLPDTQQIQVPLHDETGSQWGNVEVLFTPLPGPPLAEWSLFALITTGGLIAFMLYLRRALRAQAPPPLAHNRVKAALDTLTEGVMVIDQDGRIMLANQAMGEMLETKPTDILGTQATDLGWLDAEQDRAPSPCPWAGAATGHVCQGKRMRLQTPGNLRTLAVNATPILEADGHPQGVLVAFEDVTLLEEKNRQLIAMAQRMGDANEQVKLQNNELQRLAKSVGEVDEDGLDLSNLLNEVNKMVDLCAEPEPIDSNAIDPHAHLE